MPFLPFLPFASEPSYLRSVRASAWYDLAVTWPFALPWTLAWLHARLAALPGVLPALDVQHVLFANLLGSVVVVWSLARLLQPSVVLGRLDALARLLFAAWQAYAVARGASAVVLGFTLFELLFGVLQARPVAGASGPGRRQ